MWADVPAGHARECKGEVMSLPRIAARKELLAKEKELTRRRDALNTERRNLPMVEIEKDYIFDGPDGAVRLIDMFEGRRQLIIFHFMFDPEWEDGCPSCTAGTDELSVGFFEHLHTRDTSYAMVSRAPVAKLERWKAKRGWDIPWYSSFGTDFNYDFGVTIDEPVAPGEYNFRTKAEFEAMGSDFFASDQPFEIPGRSCLLQVDGHVFHTYSQYARVLESTGGSYYFLDLTALGRQEEWEEPKGRSDSVTSGNVPDSDPVTFNNAGTFYGQAVYSGDANNNGATSDWRHHERGRHDDLQLFSPSDAMRSGSPRSPRPCT